MCLIGFVVFEAAYDSIQYQRVFEDEPNLFEKSVVA